MQEDNNYFYLFIQNILWLWILLCDFGLVEFCATCHFGNALAGIQQIYCLVWMVEEWERNLCSIAHRDKQVLGTFVRSLLIQCICSCVSVSNKNKYIVRVGIVDEEQSDIQERRTLVPATNFLSLHFHTFSRWPDVGPFEFLRLQPPLCIGGCPLLSCVDFQYIHLFIPGGKFQTGEPSRFSSIRCTCFASNLSDGFERISLEATKFRTWQSGIDQNYFTSKLGWEILHLVFVRSRTSTSGSLRYCLLLLF